MIQFKHIQKRWSFAPCTAYDWASSSLGTTRQWWQADTQPSPPLKLTATPISLFILWSTWRSKQSLVNKYPIPSLSPWYHLLQMVAGQSEYLPLEGPPAQLSSLQGIPHCHCHVPPVTRTCLWLFSSSSSSSYYSSSSSYYSSSSSYSSTSSLSARLDRLVHHRYPPILRVLLKDDHFFAAPTKLFIIILINYIWTCTPQVSSTPESLVERWSLTKPF